MTVATPFTIALFAGATVATALWGATEGSRCMGADFATEGGSSPEEPGSAWENLGSYTMQSLAIHFMFALKFVVPVVVSLRMFEAYFLNDTLEVPMRHHGLVPVVGNQLFWSGLLLMVLPMLLFLNTWRMPWTVTGRVRFGGLLLLGVVLAHL